MLLVFWKNMKCETNSGAGRTRHVKYIH